MYILLLEASYFSSVKALEGTIIKAFIHQSIDSISFIGSFPNLSTMDICAKNTHQVP